MDYDKEYFQKKLAASKERYEKASESDKEKMRRTAEWLADKSRISDLSDYEEGNSEFIFFYGSESVFSQWHRCSFQEKDLRFTSTEQYMMYHKALLFSDFSAASEIIELDYDPKQQKEIGRRISGFNQQVWDAEKQFIVYKGNHSKFSQNKILREKLFMTSPKILVEASPVDCIWGIGLSSDDPDRLNRKLWKGKSSRLHPYYFTS